MSTLAYRVSAHGLHRRERTPVAAAAACGLTDFPIGAADLALAARADADAPVRRTGLVSFWALRGATFVVPERDRAVFAYGARPTTPASWRTFLGGWGAAYAGDHEAAVALVTGEVLDLLAGGPMTKGELSGALRPRLPDEMQPYCKGCAVRHVPETLLRAAGLSGAVVHDAERRLVRVDPPQGDPAAARAELVRRFLRCYGPARPGMLAHWLGVAAAEARRSWPDDLVAVAEGLLHPDDVPAYEDPPAAGGVRLLGAGDPLLHMRDRDVLTPDKALQRRVWRILGNPGVVLVDGRPAGLWRPRKSGARLTLTVEPFGAPLPDLDEEAARVAAVRGCREAVVETA